MRLYELAYFVVKFFMPYLHAKVHVDLKWLIRSMKKPVKLLDAGARNSPYTIGLPACVTLVDLPRQTELQKKFNLGLNEDMIRRIKTIRSNVEEVRLENIISSDLLPKSLDLVIAIEALEHVTEDELFISKIHGLLKPGGIFYVTTPNGDYIKELKPAHIRHYTRDQLLRLLK